MLSVILYQCERMFRRERGQGLVEYALIIALVAIVVFGALLALSGWPQTILSNISNSLNGVPPTPTP